MKVHRYEPDYIGPVLMALAFVVLWGYPVTRESLRAMEQKSGAQK